MESSSTSPIPAAEETRLIDLNYPDPASVELEAGKTLLLIIDMENENAHPDGALYKRNRL